MTHPADTAIEAEIVAKGLTAPRVSPDRIAELMARVQFSFHVQGTSTFCYAFLDGEFYLAAGHSACVSKENFDAELGQKIAKANVMKPATDKLWELEGYTLRQHLAEEFSPFDDVLGKQVRKWAEALKSASVRLDRPAHVSAVMTLIEMMVECNAGEMDVTLEGLDFAGVPLGDWSVKIERVYNDQEG
jgi:hypothetical protein